MTKIIARFADGRVRVIYSSHFKIEARDFFRTLVDFSEDEDLGVEFELVEPGGWQIDWGALNIKMDLGKDEL